MKIYTRGGDTGDTALYGGQRVGKNNARIEAAGAVDELNAALGLAAAQLAAADWECPLLTELLTAVQHHLFDLGAELASPQPAEQGTTLLEDRHVETLEQAIDQLESQLQPLRQFVLPGGDLVAAQLHLARAVCRRAERSIVTLTHVDPVRNLPVKYVNRLGDLLFVAARTANHSAGRGDVPWDKRA